MRRVVQNVRQLYYTREGSGKNHKQSSYLTVFAECYGFCKSLILSYTTTVLEKLYDHKVNKSVRRTRKRTDKK